MFEQNNPNTCYFRVYVPFVRIGDARTLDDKMNYSSSSSSGGGSGGRGGDDSGLYETTHVGVNVMSNGSGKREQFWMNP